MRKLCVSVYLGMCLTMVGIVKTGLVVHGEECLFPALLNAHTHTHIHSYSHRY